ncbi:AAA family ATPase [Salinicoccus cyprini]|uniref:AAA family ATPase n=1 Tax=Salinicoccus cyprini TaxID=2493691 RepID=A0A558AZX4_9STAP|nr:AAA family ATPase [Salinicoccus cyprini]TVT29810.1 AAA family ATPase [Salinicoccus cyprini]
MKIIALNIYGYGKITETEINTNQHFIQFFGENEAGKSTMQSFIHSILFGFPTRKEQEPRREPRMHNLYGGKITVDFPDEDGPIEIERIKGKIQGDVKVYFDDGTVRGEDWLIKKLNFIDKKTYRSIFSFDVLGLQDIHKNMTEDKLQEYLLRAGALGSHEYDEMLSAIDTEMKSIYKKNGINPELNREMEEMSDITGRIKALEQTEEQYKHLVNEKIKTEESLNAKKNALYQLDTVRKQKMKEVMYHKDIKEWKSLEDKLNIDPVIFPEQGLERYEALKHQVQQTKQDIALRSEKLKVLKAELAGITLPDKSRLSYLESIQKKEPDIKQKHLEYARLNLAIETLEEEIVQLRRDIGWNHEHHEVDDSNIVKESVQTVLSKIDEVALEEQFLVREIDHLKSDIKQLNHDIERLEEEQISDDRIRIKKEVIDREFELKEKEKMFSLIEKDYEREKRERNRIKRGQSGLIIGISVIALITGIFYLFNSNWLMGGIFLAIGVITLLLLMLTNQKEDDSLRNDYEDEVKELKEIIETIKRNNNVDFDLNDARDLKMDLKTQKTKRISANVRLEEMKETLALKETTHDSLNTDLAAIKQDLKVNPDIENKYIVDAIHTIREIKQKRNQISRHNVEMDNINRELKEFKRSVKDELVKFDIHYDDSTVFYDVKNMVSKMYKDENHYNRLKDQIGLLENEIKVLSDRNNAGSEEIIQLFDYVDAEDEEEYYYFARKYKEYHSNIERFRELSEKLEEEHFDYDARNELSKFLLADLKEEEDAISEQIEEFNQKVQNEQKVLAELNSEISNLESDGKLSEVNHQFEMKKAFIQNLSQEYMSLNYIRILIETHIKAIKDERLPVVIEEARSIFEKVTRGRYINVIYDEDGIKVRHVNGQLFHPLELSQSTKEMLYISLRLSLIKALKGYYQLPLIIDDAFVHFDKERKKIIMDYLRSEVNDQVLYFTCNLDSAISSSQTVKLKERVK